MRSAQPLVSVVTVNLNDFSGLESTLKSVLAQTYPYVEIIVVDGGSRDGSKSLIDNYSDKITKWVSEPDQGVYDAMNKGVTMGEGEWVIFMNAGDSFADDKVMQRVFSLPVDEMDFIYGHHKVVYEDGFERIHHAGDLSHFWKGMVSSHQALFSRVDLLKKNPFNIVNVIGADFEMLFMMYINGKRFYNSNIIISSIRSNGMSDINRIYSVCSHFRTVVKYKIGLTVFVYYAIAIVYAMLSRFARLLLPEGMLSEIVRYKYCFLHKNINRQ